MGSWSATDWGPRLLRDSVLAFARACFPHNDAHYLDGTVCAAFADGIPSASAVDESPQAWPRDDLRYLAYAMGCTDGMRALCEKARDVYRAAAASSASWLAICEDRLAGRPPAGTCPLLADPDLSDTSDRRQRLRCALADLFRLAFNLDGRQ